MGPDLAGMGREILNSPNRPMDAALKLGIEGPFCDVPPQGFGTKPSSWQVGLEVPGKVCDLLGLGRAKV